MFYEVFIPSNGSDGFDVTITVEADNWMTALKSGLERTGQGDEVIRNVMCDIKEDNTIHVTDASTSRVFVLREIDDEEAVAADQPADITAESLTQSPTDTIMDIRREEHLDEQTESEELSEDDISEFATQKMAPIAPPLTGKQPVLGKSDFAKGYKSREMTQPRHRTKPPVSTTSPPPEASGKSPRGAGPRATTASGTHAPPPGAAPPPVVRQSGSVPTIPAPAVSSGAVTQPLTPTTPPAHAPPPIAQSSSVSVVAESRPHAEPPAASVQVAAAPAPVEVAPEPVVEVVSDPIPDIPMEEGLEERSWTSEDGRMRIGSATFEALKRDEPEPKVVRETRAPSGQRPAIDIGREPESVSQNALEEVFLEINQIHEGSMSMEQVINYVMDLSLSKIRAEAGSIMFADVNGRELYFATARGPRAQEVMDFRVPMTMGLVGFCAREGVSLAISDAEKDPRFYKEISLKLGYATRNICCAPIQFEGRVYGAIELMNKDQPFTNNEVNVLTYIGRQLAKFVNDLIMAREKI